jgi:type VI secretion system protein ImpC
MSPTNDPALLRADAPKGELLLEELDDFTRLLEGEIKPKTDEAQREIQKAVRSLAEQVLEHTTLISDDAIETIQGLISEIDRKLADQVNEIIHQPDFQALEGTWRGLFRLVSETETDAMLRIKVLNASKKEVGRMLRRHQGALWDQSPLFKKVYEEEYGTAGGHPYGAIIGDYYFSQSAQDLEVLKGMARIAAASHAPFIAGAAPALLGMESFQEMSNPRDIKLLFTTPDYAAWRSFRESDDSKYVGLTLPRYLSRLPYGEEGQPVEEFAFEEDVASADSSKFVWSNASYAMGSNITRAFKEFGWCSQIAGFSSGGLVEDLPVHTFPSDDGGVDLKCPTEIAITDRREKELSDSGLMPLVFKKNTDQAFFIDASSTHESPKFDDPEATANAKLGSKLTYLFATCRFAHYLKCMVRDHLGSHKEKEELRLWLHKWIMQYVLTNPEQHSEEEKARKPLAAAGVEVEEDPENPGYYNSKFYLRPHYQLQGLSVSLRLVSKIPSGKQK